MRTCASIVGFAIAMFPAFAAAQAATDFSTLDARVGDRIYVTLSATAPRRSILLAPDIGQDRKGVKLALAF